MALPPCASAAIAECQATGHRLEVPKRIADCLGIKDREVYNVRCGLRSATALVRVKKRRANRIRLSPALHRSLLVPTGITLNIVLNKGTGTIRLGPVVGVFVRRQSLQRFETGAVLTKMPPLARADIESKLNCLVYYFGTGGIDFEQRMAKGYCLISGYWHFGWLPLPDVIYDRGVRHNNDAEVNAFRQRVKELQIPRVNAVEQLGKWQTYCTLAKHPSLARHLPQTIEVGSFDDVLTMLETHTRIILKGNHGNRGRQVMLITKLGQTFEISTYRGTHVVETPQGLQSQVSAFVKNRRYVAQRAVHLLQVESRNMDFRILAAKDARGRWTVVYSTARIAQQNFSITNCALGADEVWAVDALCRAGWTPAEASLMNQRLNNLSLEVAQCIEKEFGSFGELGIDLGIDVDKNIWIFEVNTRPVKRLGPGLDNKTRPLMEFIPTLEYCMFLSGFNPGQS